MAKEVVDLKKELGTGADAPVTLKPKLFRFKKLQFPLQAVKLGSGRRVTFQVLKLNTGGFSRWGILETEDPKLAEELRALSKANSQYVKEV